MSSLTTNLNVFRRPQPLIKLCHDLLQHQPRELPVKCAECGVTLKVFHNGKSRITSHFGKNLFTCRHCNYSTSRKASVNLHISTVHKLNGKVENHYCDSSQCFQMAMKVAMLRCFGQTNNGKNQLVEEENKTYKFFEKLYFLLQLLLNFSILSINRTQSRSRGKPLLTIRNVFILRLLQKI